MVSLRHTTATTRSISKRVCKSPGGKLSEMLAARPALEESANGVISLPFAIAISGLPLLEIAYLSVVA